jgi:hypothetical protein
MMKRVGVLAMILAGGLALFAPSAAQANERNDFRRYDRHEDRRDWYRHERREVRRENWRERERFERRDYRNPYYAQPYYYNGYMTPYCPR